MISVIVLFRNARQMATDCVQSLAAAMRALHVDAEQVEFVLIDDFSDEQAQIPQLLKEFRASVQPNVQIIALRRHSHYAYGLALGMSLARGENVLFISHDMIVPPACVRTLLEVAAAHAEVGIVRPRSRHMDGAPAQVLAPPLNLRTPDDVNSFGELIRTRFGLETANERMFIGDAMLIKRSVIDRVGVFDTRFFGFMADIDYGLRAQRAGFKVATARGAWLHHLGGGFSKDVELSGGDWKSVNLKNRADASAAWSVFRTKWDLSLPDDRTKAPPGAMSQLLALPAGEFDAVCPPLRIDPAICEVL